MSSRFASLTARPPAPAAPVQPEQQQVPAPQAPAPAAAEPTPARAKVPAARVNKVPVIGYFSDELRQGLKLLAVQERTSVQSLLGEAIDLLMRQRGKHPFAER